MREVRSSGKPYVSYSSHAVSPESVDTQVTMMKTGPSISDLNRSAKTSL